MTVDLIVMGGVQGKGVIHSKFEASVTNGASGTTVGALMTELDLAGNDDVEPVTDLALDADGLPGLERQPR